MRARTCALRLAAAPARERAAYRDERVTASAAPGRTPFAKGSFEIVDDAVQALRLGGYGTYLMEAELSGIKSLIDGGDYAGAFAGQREQWLEIKRTWAAEPRAANTSFATKTIFDGIAAAQTEFNDAICAGDIPKLMTEAFTSLDSFKNADVYVFDANDEGAADGIAISALPIVDGFHVSARVMAVSADPVLDPTALKVIFLVCAAEAKGGSVGRIDPAMVVEASLASTSNRAANTALGGVYDTVAATCGPVAGVEYCPAGSKRIGFITPESVEKDIFVHSN